MRRFQNIFLSLPMLRFTHVTTHGGFDATPSLSLTDKRKNIKTD